MKFPIPGRSELPKPELWNGRCEMVTVERSNDTLVQDLAQPTQMDYAQCGVIYLECAICGNCAGTRDVEGFSGVIEVICLNCREREDRAGDASLPAPADQWHYTVPCAGVRYYGF